MWRGSALLGPLDPRFPVCWMDTHPPSTGWYWLHLYCEVVKIEEHRFVLLELRLKTKLEMRRDFIVLAYFRLSLLVE